MVLRLLNFRRIDHTLFCELLCEKFGLRNAEPLFDELFEKGGTRLYDQVIMVTDEVILQQYLVPPGRLQEYLQSEEALN